jgi:serine/threonine-protein kinase
LGAGGMGEVYRAADTRLGRDVAIKLLPARFTDDRDRLHRFEREAQVLASLNHPHIAAIYGMEIFGNSCALVMELVEGPTLADRIARGPIPARESMLIAKQIAVALEYAHERGIVHRDLKPANIKLAADGQVKVLDFGLAKAMSDPALAYDMAESPTELVTGTRDGVILGTAAYMAPEQANGQPVDRRADVWAFGLVLFEMLTGRRAYQGHGVSELLAAVMRDEPDWKTLPVGTPSRVRELLRRCQAKDPRLRLQAIGEARILLDEAIAHPEAERAGVAPGPAPARLWSRALPWVAAGVLAVLAGMLWIERPAAPVMAPIRLTAELSPNVSLVPALGPAVVVSPDGSTIAFRGRMRETDKPQIFVRRLNQIDAVPLPGTEDVGEIFFSPNGLWLGFSAGQALKKIPVTGGDAITLCPIGLFRGGDWTEDGHIIFAASRSGLFKVSADGGQPEQLTTLNQAAGQITHRLPQVLPGGKVVLFTAHTNSVSYDDASIMAQPLAGGPSKLILRGGFAPRYVSSGHLLYLHNNTLFAVPFDLNRLEVMGTAVPAIERVANTVGSAGAQFSVSSNGTLAYLPDRGFSNAVPIEWIDAQGKFTSIHAPGPYLAPRLSPDGRRLALEVFENSQSHIWVYDLEREVMSRLTADAADEERPLWSPDGRDVVFSSDREGSGKTHLYAKRVDSADAPLRLTDDVRSEREVAESWLPDGRTLMFHAINPPTEWDVFMLRVEGHDTPRWTPQAPTPLLNSARNETQPALSPDGRWLAYRSDETGKQELYVRRFPELDGKEQISAGGGELPTWSRGGRELLYHSPNSGEIMAVSYAPVGAEFHASKPRVWATVRLAGLDGVRNFDVHPDGKRLVILRAPETPVGAARDKVVLCLNFLDELRRIAPAGKR